MAGSYGKESETQINFDYPEEEVFIYTTRQGVFNRVKSRVGSENMKKVQEHYVDDGKTLVAWNFTLDMNICRDASLITKVLK